MNLLDPLIIAIYNQLNTIPDIPQEQSLPASADHHPPPPSLAQLPHLQLLETSPRE
jgi:hypothetical protein